MNPYTVTQIIIACESSLSKILVILLNGIHCIKILKVNVSMRKQEKMCVKVYFPTYNQTTQLLAKPSVSLLLPPDLFH